jgi:hypothetical protein
MYGPLLSATAASNALPANGPVQPRVASTSSSVGNRLVAFLEYASLPSTVISNTPPPDLRSSICVLGTVRSIKPAAARARGS